MEAEKYTTRTVEFDDNDSFALVTGPLDRHLALVEATVDISISRSGTRLLLQGEASNVEKAKEIFNHLQDRVTKNKGVSEEDVKGALRFAGYRVGDVVTVLEPKGIASEGLRTPRKEIFARSPAQAQMIEQLKSKTLIFGMGPAGTGKTYLAVAAAVAALNAGRVKRIILSRPAVEAGERIGFLPGDIKEKVDPYMQPLYDALRDTIPTRQLDRMYEDNVIEIAPLAFMRGRTLANAFVVLDEAQNATVPQMKLFLTRLGEGATMAITGDETQVDLPAATPSGLVDAVNRLQTLRAVGVTRFTDTDVVRHPLVAEIIRAYNR